MKNSKRRKDNLLKKVGRRGLNILLSIFLIVGILFTNSYDVNAKDVGDKNEETCDHCEMVVNGEAPKMKDYSSYVAGKNPEPENALLDDRKAGLSYDSTGYSSDVQTYEKLLDGAVYRGGNSKSGIQAEGKDKDTYLDEDPNDFASVLPYGNTYIDTSKLNWNENSNYIIEIADNLPFQWIAGENYKDRADSNGLPVETDPLGDGSGLAADIDPVIAYVGPIKGYLGDTPEDWRGDAKSAPADGQENIFDAADLGLEYLYKMTYPNAAILKDGTRGNLVITATRVEIETTATQDNAVITLQKANQLDLGAKLKNKNGDYINTQGYVVKTADEMRDYLKGTSLGGNGWIVDKHTNAVTGTIIDLDIKITDAQNNAVNGSISYAAKDMDIVNHQSQWGRSIKGEDRYKFNEGMAILDGSLSYAVTPYYDHWNATTRATGWIPVRPGSDEVRTSPLHIARIGTGDGPADGIRFSSIGNVMLRDQNESFENAIVNWSGPSVKPENELRTILGGTARNSDYETGIMEKLDIESYTIKDAFKQQLEGKIKDGDTVVPWGQMTNQQIFDYIGDASFGDRRGDNNQVPDIPVFDTGFAVLMDASGFKLQWSASMHNAGSVATTLFDNSIYTFVEQSHGVGGGTYLETYDITKNCDVNRNEGVSTMARGTNAVVTVVPEDGHRVKTIMVGGLGLSDPVSYEIDKLTFENNQYKDSDNGVIIEKNDDGTYDVILENVQDPRHVHADFTTDYYFYKVWKDAKTHGVDTIDLTLTATPYILENGQFTEAGTPVTFTVSKKDAENSAETHVVETTEGNDKVWKITYPGEGYTTKNGDVWQELPLEPTPNEHNVNHDEVRYYWFVTETVNGWKLKEYNNAEAKVTGVVSEAESRGETKESENGYELTWATKAKKDHDTAEGLIKAKTDAASMSVFSDGGKIENEITPPEGTPKETYGAKNTPQTADAKKMFSVTTETTLDGSPNEIEKYELLDAEGNPTNEVTVEGGKYTIDENGVITFTPDKDYVGNPPAVRVRGTDGNGLTAETTYTPHIVENEKKVTRTITYEYSNGDPVLDEEGKPKTVIHTTTFVGTVNPETGELTFPDNPTDEFPQVDSDPIEGYMPDKDSVSSKTVTPSDSDWEEKVIYDKTPNYSINYDKNGGEGEMSDNHYRADDESMPYNENKFTRKGYHFTGFYAYITDPETGEETLITDESGNPIVFTGTDDMSKYFEGMPDKTSIRMEAHWQPDTYIIKYDANGGEGTMSSQYINGADGKAISKPNEFTRKGYEFIGFKAVLPDGTYLKDIMGNELVFKDVKDFFNYLAEYGNGAEVTLIAQWKPLPVPDTSDNSNLGLWATIMSFSLVIALTSIGLKKAYN